VFGIACLAFFTGFEAIKSYAVRSQGIAPKHGWAVPLLVDSFIVVATGADLWFTTTSRRRAWWEVLWPKLLLASAAGASFMLNVAHAGPTAEQQVAMSAPLSPIQIEAMRRPRLTSTELPAATARARAETSSVALPRPVPAAAPRAPRVADPQRRRPTRPMVFGASVRTGAEALAARRVTACVSTATALLRELRPAPRSS
jgi:hypothetical protein